MSDIAIRVENLGKLYHIGPRQRYRTLRDTLTAAMYAPFRRLPSLFGNPQSAIRNPQSAIRVRPLPPPARKFEIRNQTTSGPSKTSPSK